jgi:hypothetical protein
MIDSLRDQVRLYEILKAFLVQINANEKALLTSEAATGSVPTDGNQADVLVFNGEEPGSTEWKAPHEIDTYVSGVF